MTIEQVVAVALGGILNSLTFVIGLFAGIALCKRRESQHVGDNARRGYEEKSRDWHYTFPAPSSTARTVCRGASRDGAKPNGNAP